MARAANPQKEKKTAPRGILPDHQARPGAEETERTDPASRAGAETAIGLLSPVKLGEPVKHAAGLARDMRGRHSTWPQSGQSSRYMISKTRLRLKLRSRCACVCRRWSMRAAMGQLPCAGCAGCAVFGCAVADRERNGQASNKSRGALLNPRRRNDAAPGFQDGSGEGNSAFPYLHPVLINIC